MIFQDKVVWITGASSGLGKFMAIEFARQGAKLALSGRRIEQLEAVRTAVIAAGGVGEIFPCEVTDEAALEETVKVIVGHFGKLDVAIANAGFGVFGKIESLSAANWRKQLDVNVVGLAMTAKFALPFLKQTGGRLVLI